MLLIRMVFWRVLFCFSTLNAFDDYHLDQTMQTEVNQEPLFVSLGSYCTTAHWHRHLGLRKAAFPFDWIVSFDGERLIEIIESDFLHFLNPAFLTVAQSGDLLHTYYHLEFLNEGDWSLADRSMENFLLKCQRRIDRFRLLENYRGKVFFVRTAIPPSVPTEGRVWQFNDNVNISSQFAKRLYAALKRRFPALNFDLVIVNEHVNCEIDRSLSESIWMIRTPNSEESYREFYSKLR